MDTFMEQQQPTHLDHSGHAPLGLEGRRGRGSSSGARPSGVISCSMMLPPVPRQPERSGYEILSLGAHRDDLEIGCGGTMLRPRRQLPIERVTSGVLSGDEDRAREARQGARRLLGRHAGARLIEATVRDGFIPDTATSIKECFEQLKREVEPDLVLTHDRDDRHRDHRLVSELTTTPSATTSSSNPRS
jgi:LmbE family N-acetylglucosaminyl deacetylase